MTAPGDGAAPAGPSGRGAAKPAGRPHDVRVRPFPALTAVEWQQPKDALRTLYREAEARAIEAHEWYLRDRVRKKAMSRALRAAAVLLGAAGGLQPLVSVAAFGRSSSWGYVLLALAGACVGFDYFLGLSADWLRDMRTAQRIQRRVHRFQVDWAAMDAEQATGPGSAPVDVQRYLDELRAFLTDISDIMIEETGDWAAEVQTGIARLQGQTKAGG